MVLLVRAWMEEGRPDGFRARLVQTDTPWGTPGSSAQIVTASLDETVSAVRAWLALLEADASAPTDGTTRR